jgi:hypothetical protein
MCMSISKKVESIVETKMKLNAQMAEINSLFDEVCSGCLQAVVDFGSVVIKDKYKDEQYSFFAQVDFFESEDEVVRTWVKKLAEIMLEQDYPVSQAQGKKFCNFFELNELEISEIMNRCANDDQFEEYVNYERRNMEW